MILSAIQFVRRFLMHVLPSGFVRVRHYGFLANCHRREKLALCRKLMGLTTTSASETPEPNATPEQLSPVTPTKVCPNCGSGRMIVIEEFPAMPMSQQTLGRADLCLTHDTS
jgi:hypothetical protein